MSDYLYAETGNGPVRYPTDEAFTERTQSARPADELVYVVLWDVVDVAQSAGLLDTAYAARALAVAAGALWHANADGWLDAENADKLQDLLVQAEQLEGIRVDWDGDAGTVTVSLSDKWEPVPVSDRLEYLREQIRAECISMSELHELQGLADQIDPSDVELLEWAGVPEFPDDDAERNNN